MAFSGGKELKVYIGSDISGLTKGIKKSERGLKGLGDSLNKFLGPALIAGAAAAGAFAVKIGIDAVNAASDLLETQNKVGVIFGESSQAILDFAQTSVTALGQTEEQALEAAATFAQFGKAAGLAGDDLVNFSTDFVTLSADLASFNNSSPEEAITALGAALRGEALPLRRFGVLLDEATLKEEALALGISDGTSKLNTQQKVLAAHAVVLRQTADAQGDFARTADGLANTTRILSAAVEDAKAEIGLGLVFAIEEATAAMGGSQGMAQGISKLGQEIGLFTRGVGLAIGEVIELKDAFNELNTSATVTGTSIKVTDAAMVGLRASVAFASMGLSEIGMQFRNRATEADNFKKKIDGVRDSTIELAKAERMGRIDARIAQEQMITSTRDSGIAAALLAKQEERLAPYLARKAKLLAETTTKTNSYTKATDELTKSQKRAEEQFTTALDTLTSYQTAITSGLDLGAAFSGQFDEAGKATGISLLDGFNQQIDQANLFGGILNQLQDQKGSEALIQQIASLGPLMGAQLGQQLIDDGLVTTMSEKWDNVQKTTMTLAMGLVPEFLTAGIESGNQMVLGLAQQIGLEQKTLKKLGKNMAKPVGAAFKSRLARDVAEAVRNVEAAGTAARAERVASATAAQQSLTDQAVATAISNVLRRGDARAGSAVQPVLT
jgi:hypothetical protein